MQHQVWDISQLDDFFCVVEKMACDVARGVVYLQGDLGVGKTALVQHWLKYLGVKVPVTSPSYQIVNHYEANGKRFIHADLYRLADADELLYLDVRDWTEQADLIFIEWPEKGDGYLPAPDVICQLFLIEGKRVLHCNPKRHKTEVSGV